MSTLSVGCPYCQKTIKVPEKMVGREIRCPGCKQGLKLEGAGGPPPDGGGAGGVDFGSLSQDTGRGRRPSAFWELLTFRRMIAPFVLQLVFWVLVLLAVGSGGLWVVLGVLALGTQPTAPAVKMTDEHGPGMGNFGPFEMGTGTMAGGVMIVVGLAWMILGPLVIRVFFEMLIMVFRVYDVMREVRDKLDRR